MNTTGIENNLTQAVKDLCADWQQARAHWRDAKAAEFEQRFLDELPPRVMRATLVITEINALLKKVKSDCE